MILVLSLVGLLVSARSLQIGPAVPVIALTSTTANAVTIAAGPLVFGEPLPDEPLALAVRLAAFALVIGAAAMTPPPMREPAPGVAAGFESAGAECEPQPASRRQTSPMVRSWCVQTVVRSSLTRWTSVRAGTAQDAEPCAAIVAGLDDYFTEDVPDKVRRDLREHGGWVVDDAGGLAGFVIVERRGPARRRSCGPRSPPIAGERASAPGSSTTPWTS